MHSLQGQISSQKESTGALTGWLSWLRIAPYIKEVARSMPGQGTFLTCRFDLWSRRVWEAIDNCFSLTSMFLPISLSLSLKLKRNKHILKWGFKKKKGGHRRLKHHPRHHFLFAREIRKGGWEPQHLVAQLLN